MEKAKRKRELHHPNPIIASLTVPAVEFVSPLSMEECVRRLREKGRWGHKSQNKLEITLIPTGKDSFDFHLLRTIGEQSTMPYMRQRNVTHVRVKGQLSFWDHGETLVSCRANSFASLVLMPIVFVPVFCMGSLLALARSRSAVEALLFFTMLAIVIMFIYFYMRMTVVAEHRKLVALVEDMLRDPIIL